MDKKSEVDVGNYLRGLESRIEFLEKENSNIYSKSKYRTLTHNDLRAGLVLCDPHGVHGLLLEVKDDHSIGQAGVSNFGINKYCYSSSHSPFSILYDSIQNAKEMLNYLNNNGCVVVGQLRTNWNDFVIPF